MLDEQLLNILKEYNHCRKYNKDFVKDKKLESLLSARYHKVSRIKQHLVWLYHHKKNIYFITFTFSDENLKKCDRTKKDMIKKSLLSFDEDIYIILNIDYGKKNEREHYHCIVGTDSDLDLRTFLQLVYPDIIWCQNVNFSSDSISQLPKYLNKLTNHAIKNTTKNSRIYFNFKGYGNISRKSCPEVYFTYKEDLDLVSLS